MSEPEFEERKRMLNFATLADGLKHPDSIY